MSKILVVDDEPGVRNMVAAVLEDEGYEVRTAGNGRQALEALEAEPFDLAVLDIMLPGIDGRDLARQMEETPYGKRVPVILMSAAVRPGEQDRHHLAGFLTKPFDIETLIETVAATLRGDGAGHGQ